MGNSEKKVFTPEMYLQSSEHVKNTHPVLAEYYQVKSRGRYITQEIFSQEILYLPLTSKLSHYLFNVFSSSSHNVITKDDLELFYTAFTSSYKEIQALMITELVFVSALTSLQSPTVSDRINSKLFKTNFMFFFPDLPVLTLQYIENKLKGKNEIDKESSYKLIKHKLPNGFTFIKQYCSTSMKEMFNDDGNKKVYVCDCELENKNNNNNNANDDGNGSGSSKQNEKEDAVKLEEKRNYFRMFQTGQDAFHNMEYDTNGMFKVSDFEQMLIKFEVKPQLAHVIKGYLRKQLCQERIMFNNLKEIFVKFALATTRDDKIELLYELCKCTSTSSSSIQQCNNEAIQILFPNININNNNTSNTSISKDEFISLINDPSNADTLNDILNSFDLINFFPYIKLRIVPKKRSIFKQLYNKILNNKTLDEKLQEDLANPKIRTFVMLDKPFTDNLTTYLNTDTTTTTTTTTTSNDDNLPQINFNNLRHQQYTSHRNILQPHLSYKDDYYLINLNIYSNYFERWFKPKSTQLTLSKIQYDISLIKDETIIDGVNVYHPNNIILQYQKDNTVYEIEQCTIHLNYFTLREVYEYYKSTMKTKEFEVPSVENIIELCLNKLIMHGRRNMVVSRKDKVLKAFNDMVNDVNNQCDKYDSPSLIYFNPYNKQFGYISEMDKTFEEHAIYGNVLFLIDSVFDVKMEKYYGGSSSSMRYNGNNSVSSGCKMKLKTSFTFYEFFFEKKTPEYIEEVIETTTTTTTVATTTTSTSLTANANTNITKDNNKDLLNNEDQTQPDTEQQTKRVDLIEQTDISYKQQQQQQSSSSKDTSNDIINSPLKLRNIGNTCYLNSIMQILLNLPLIKSTLLHANSKYLINRLSKFSHYGEFIDEFLQVLQLRWSTNIHKLDSLINLTNLKRTTGSIHTQFNNNDQQDASEFLNFVLDELNEELNLKIDKPYIEHNEHLIKYNTEETLSDLYWANAIRRSPSIINSIFAFQLKSVLTCAVCHKQNITYETNTNLYAPIPTSKYISVNIHLKRLPFNYKLYYDKLDKKFKEYNVVNKDKSVIMNLHNYFNDVVVYSKEDNVFNRIVPCSFTLTIDKKKTIGELIKKLRSNKTLQLEPDDDDNDNNNDNTTTTSTNKQQVKTITSFIISTMNRTTSSNYYLSENMKIDECIHESHQRIEIIESFNANGWKLFNNIFNTTTANTPVKPHPQQQNNILLTTITKPAVTTVSQRINELTTLKSLYTTQTEVASLSTYNYYNIIKEHSTNTDIKDKEPLNTFTSYEYPITIKHSYQENENTYIFYPFTRKTVNLPVHTIILNNSQTNINNYSLYEYIWGLFHRYLKTPNKTFNNLWWRLYPNNLTQCKVCYPFNIKICKQEHNQYKCARCPWWKFCPGCILQPLRSDILNIQSNDIVLIEWCISFIKNELTKDNELKLTHLNIEDDDEIQKSQSKDFGYTLDECIQLFLAEEKLEDTIYCNNCACAQLFTKHYSIDKTPPVLIISLKRFKYVGTLNNKITTYINFPLRDFHVNNDTYDLYGVVNHMGDLNYGHYTCIINMNGQWMCFDDGIYYTIRKEEEVISSRAYILVYVNKKEPEGMMYYQLMRDIMLNFNAEDVEKEFTNDKTFTQHDVVPRKFYTGEPVNTKYGKGYYVKDVSDVLGEIKTDKLVITLPKWNIQHETVLSIKKVTPQMIKQKKKEDKERKKQEEIKREKERKERLKKKEEEERMKRQKEEQDKANDNDNVNGDNAMKFTEEEIEQQRLMLAQIQENNMQREYQYQQYQQYDYDNYDSYAQYSMAHQMHRDRDRRSNLFGLGSLFGRFTKGSSARKKKH